MRLLKESQHIDVFVLSCSTTATAVVCAIVDMSAILMNAMYISGVVFYQMISSKMLRNTAFFGKAFP